MNNRSRSRVFPLVRVLVLLLIVSSILTMVAFISRSKVAAVGGSQENVFLALELFATGLKEPVSITNAGAGDDRLFVNEKGGLIKIVQPDGTVKTEPFLDISDRVSTESEQGLLGLAFHPNYTENGYFFVNYTNVTSATRQTRISRFEVSSNPNDADESKEDIILTIAQPSEPPGEKHNAGDIHFGPDGYLYIPLGDGQGGGDKPNNAQNPAVLLGKVVRIDVDSDGGNVPPDCVGSGSGNYRVPSTNPWISAPGDICDEIWASGLRNPWRSSFDRLTGDFYIGDVGEGTKEEINFQKAGSAGGQNYGWSCHEGSEIFNASVCDTQEVYTFPIFEYETHVDGCSITGGYVYRGSNYPDLAGRYIFADWCSGNFWDLINNGGNWQPTKHTNLTDFGYVTFGEDSQGELYVGNLSSGNIYVLEGQIPEFDEFVYLPVIVSPTEPVVPPAAFNYDD